MGVQWGKAWPPGEGFVIDPTDFGPMWPTGGGGVETVIEGIPWDGETLRGDDPPLCYIDLETWEGQGDDDNTNDLSGGSDFISGGESI